MGIEYKVRFKANDAAQKDIFLRNLPNFTEFSKEWQSYRYHVEDNTGKMPNMEIRIEDEGLYLCDYNMSRHFFGLIVTKLISEFGSVMIEEYES